MAGTRKRDQQARQGWPLNGRRRPEKQTAGFRSPKDANSPAQDAAPGAEVTALVEASRHADSATAVSGPGPTAGTGSAPGHDGLVYASGAVVPVDPYATADEDPYALYTDFDDTVLGGLHYRTAVPRQPVGDVAWAGALRRFARATVWCLPAAVLALAVGSISGWPTPTAETSGASPGTWLVLNLFGLGLWLAGVVGLSALVASTALRPWGIVAVISSIAGTVLVAPVLGVLGLARPAVARTADAIGPAPAGHLQAQFLDGAVSRWLVIGGFVLLAVGAIAVAGAILGSRMLSRTDGWLVLAAVAVATVAAYLSWEFMLTIAALVMLAATLGLAWTVSRLSVDGGLWGAD